MAERWYRETNHLLLHHTTIHEAVEPIAGEDDVIVDGEVQVSGAFDELAGEADVLLAGSELATGMVVCEDDA